MAVCVRIFPCNAPGEGEQDCLRPLLFVRALLELQKGPYASQQFASIQRTTQEVICSHLDAFQPILLVGERRDHDHRDQICVGVVLDFLAYLKPIQVRHQHIQKHQVELSPSKFLKRSCAIRHTNHFASLCCEEFL